MRCVRELVAAVFLATTACSSSPDDGRRAGDVDERGETFAEERVDSGSGTTWTALYRDLFGPAAPSSCAGAGMCHGADGESGAQGSNGYVCATREGCRASLLSPDTGLVQSRDFAAPSNSTLIDVLRRRSPSGSVVGSMPKRSSYVFSQASIDRIETWIRSGAPDD